MTSKKQKDANRRNALLSTGPKTDEGKKVSKLNAITHGLAAETVVIMDEDPKAFEELRDDLISEFAPETTLEFQLVDRIAGLMWRLKRVPRIEASLMEAHRLEVEYQDAYDDDLDFSSEERDAKYELRGSRAALGRAFIQGAQSLDTLGKLSRYERSLVGMLNITLHQLDQERARRERSLPEGPLVDIKTIEQDS